MNPFISTLRKWFGSRSRVTNWEEIRSQWLASDGVYAGKTGSQGKLSSAAELLLNVVVSGTWHDRLANNLSDADARVVAYCLMGLEMLNSSVLRSLPDSLILRSDPLQVMTGNTVLEIPLNMFAEEIVKRHSKGKSLDRWLSFGYKVEPNELTGLLHKLREFKSSTPNSSPQ